MGYSPRFQPSAMELLIQNKWFNGLNILKFSHETQNLPLQPRE